MNFHDTRETRDPEARERELLARLPGQIAHARAAAPAFGRLLAEQNTNTALQYSDYGYIMESGRVVMDGPAAELATNEDVKEFYLGVGGGERKSFRDVKSYKRRKRWLA